MEKMIIEAEEIIKKRWQENKQKNRHKKDLNDLDNLNGNITRAQHSECEVKRGLEATAANKAMWR